MVRGLEQLLHLRAIKARRQAEESLRRASSEFESLLRERFDDWALTPAERDVALFVIKGLSPSEIAGLRHAAEGTVKAQCNAVYRKAGVAGRFQLLSLFVEDLMHGIGPVADDRALPVAIGATRKITASRPRS